MSDLISLVMTVYNRERYLAMAIDSVLCQTHANFELIIWDDGSTDSSLAIAREYSDRDRRIKAIASEHQGRAKSLKQAHLLCQGEFVGWLDSDDVLAPSALERTLQILASNSDVGMVYTDHMIIDAVGKILGIGQRCKIPYSSMQMLLDFLTFHFRLIRRSIFERAGGIDESFICAIDYDLCLRIAEITEIYHLREILYYYRNHRQSMFYNYRLEQIECSRRAVLAALKRRGLENLYELQVEINSTFYLTHKNKQINTKKCSF
jgi:glycosyltransferase involved in cell wall biosynthesis